MLDKYQKFEKKLLREYVKTLQDMQNSKTKGFERGLHNNAHSLSNNS